MFWYTLDYAGGWAVKNFHTADFWKQDYFFVLAWVYQITKYMSMFTSSHSDCALKYWFYHQFILIATQT